MTPASFRALVTVLGLIACLGTLAGVARAEAYRAIQQPGNNIFTLNAELSEIMGGTLQLEMHTPPNLGVWSDPADYAHWVINVSTTGHYRMEITYSAPPECSGNVVDVVCGTDKLEFHPFSTGSWSDYRTAKIGEIDLNEPGHVDVALKCVTRAGGNIMNVRNIQIIPADNPNPAEDMVPVIPVADGTTLLPANAVVNGSGVSIEGDGNFGSWKSKDTYFHWPVRFNQPGKYKLAWVYSLDPSSSGTQLQVQVGNSPPILVTPDPTDNWSTYREVAIGTVTIAKAGPADVTVKATKMTASFVMNLKQITINPAKAGTP